MFLWSAAVVFFLSFLLSVLTLTPLILNQRYVIRVCVCVRVHVCVCVWSLDCFYFGKVGLWAPSPFLLLEQQLWQVTSCCLLQIVSLLKTHLAAETSRMRNESAGQETISPQTDSLCFGAVAGAGGGGGGDGGGISGCWCVWMLAVLLQTASAASRTLHPCRPRVCSIISPGGKLLIALVLMWRFQHRSPMGWRSRAGVRVYMYVYMYVCMYVCMHVFDWAQTSLLMFVYLNIKSFPLLKGENIVWTHAALQSTELIIIIFY